MVPQRQLRSTTHEVHILMSWSVDSILIILSDWPIVVILYFILFNIVCCRSFMNRKCHWLLSLVYHLSIRYCSRTCVCVCMWNTFCYELADFWNLSQTHPTPNPPNATPTQCHTHPTPHPPNATSRCHTHLFQHSLGGSFLSTRIQSCLQGIEFRERERPEILVIL